MVNGNYVLYGDRPSSESEIVDDHVHTKTAERKPKRKAHRTANELQSTLNMAQLDNETDSVKYEKRIKEPRLLRYVPTTDVEENYVTEKFETYDLKPTEERPRRYAFTKKPKNPADGSVNYAYSRSSSSCSSPNGNLPTISEHSEQYGTYRVHPITTNVEDMMSGYESKLDKYFTKHKDVKSFAAKGSHPDSLYRVAPGSGAGAGKTARTLRILRWPAALLVVCVALAVFVYFLMPDNLDSDLAANGTYWDPLVARVGSHAARKSPGDKNNISLTQDTKTPEIDFYDADAEKHYDMPTLLVTETEPQKMVPIPPVYPAHITPEVQYGNEKADTDKLRNPKLLDDTNAVPADSTLKPHITQKPEKPLAVYFKDGNGIANSAVTETIVNAETLNEYINYGDKFSPKRVEDLVVKTLLPVYKQQAAVASQAAQERPVPPVFESYSDIPPEIQEFYHRRPNNVDVNFTSGHSKLFGISIEDAERMRSTTQSSIYNTRVSPTLPTWRDGDDSTTKKYPVYVNNDAPQCRSTRLALCRGVLPYDLAGPAASIDGLEMTSLLPEIEYLIATNCSERVRQFICALLEPECNPPPFPPKMPCFNLCKAIVDGCDELIPRALAPAFKCRQYSSSNCVPARAPCSAREASCGDGACIPRDWICDGNKDCASGEDEATCMQCDKNEFHCRSGGCILKHWMCDGYSDCRDGSDESLSMCKGRIPPRPGAETSPPPVDEPGEELAGSAPAPSVRKPYRIPPPPRAEKQRAGDPESSKELLMTSDTSNALKRNFTRRPSLSRLSPYRPMMYHARPQGDQPKNVENSEEEKNNNPTTPTPKKSQSEKKQMDDKDQAKDKNESTEDVNIADLGFFDEMEKEGHQKETEKQAEPAPVKISLKDAQKTKPKPKLNALGGVVPLPPDTGYPQLDKLDKSINKLEKVIDDSSFFKKAVRIDSESNETNAEQEPEIEMPPSPAPAPRQAPSHPHAPGRSPQRTFMPGGPFPGGPMPGGPMPGGPMQGGPMPGGPVPDGSMSAHASPCPSGELRCVDGRCITLAQLCDGTIDCSDHADEDNCYT